jgi:DNA recombination protein RmuC
MKFDTTTIIIAGIATLVVILLIVIVIALFLLFRSIGKNAQVFNAVQTDVQSLGGKLEKVESSQGVTNQGVNGIGVEVRGLSERISTVERNQGALGQGVHFSTTNTISSITELKTLTSGVTEATGAIRTELSRAKSDLSELGERLSSVEKNQTNVTQGVGNLATNTLSAITELKALTTSLTEATGAMRAELSKAKSDLSEVGERLFTVEKNQTNVNQGVGHLATNTLSAITELKALTTSLTEATGAMRVELSRAKNDLTELHSHVKNGQEVERQVAESVYRLESIIAGTQSKGLAGENVLELVFSKLPIEWQVRNFRIGGKTVEFALRLPNNLIMPIDSKWAATHLLEQFIQAENIQEQQKIKKSIEDVVLQKAKEVKKYIEPSVTVNFGVAVIPDAVYDLCSGIQSEAFQLNVVLVSYSMFVPYLLLVFQTILRSSQSIDLQKLDLYLQTTQESMKALQDEIEGRFSRAITMMSNSRDEMRAHISKVNGSLTGLQISTSATPLMGELTSEETG